MQLARKRPHLIPVYDSHVKDVLGRPVNDRWWWRDLRCQLAKDEVLVGELESVRARAGVGHLSLLRTFESQHLFKVSSTPLVPSPVSPCHPSLARAVRPDRQMALVVAVVGTAVVFHQSAHPQILYETDLLDCS